jgi:hypothetical protein
MKLKATSATHANMKLKAVNVVIGVKSKRYLFESFDVRYVYGVDLKRAGEEMAMLTFRVSKLERDKLETAFHNNVESMDVYANGRRFAHRCCGKSGITFTGDIATATFRVDGYFAHDIAEAAIPAHLTDTVKISQPRLPVTPVPARVNKVNVKALAVAPIQRKSITPVILSTRVASARKAVVVRLRG